MRDAWTARNLVSVDFFVVPVASPQGLQHSSELRGWSVEETKDIVRRNLARLIQTDEWAWGRIATQA